ncbi:MAG: MaoC family dehydratase [Alphaproteobacteria bacterium]|nr:MAG: MaoC family dehydratase [Alphaproteobacteria bacterium]
MGARRYYEDLELGAVAYSGEKAVSEEEIVAFARQYDPQYFHVDPEAAKASRFGGLVASGIHNLAIWRRLDHEIASDIAWICGVGMDEIRLLNPVRPGDRLRARAECVSKRPSKRDPGRGVVVFRYSLVNQRDETVLSFLSTNLVERACAGEQSTEQS